MWTQLWLSIHWWDANYARKQFSKPCHFIAPLFATLNKVSLVQAWFKQGFGEFIIKVQSITQTCGGPGRREPGRTGLEGYGRREKKGWEAGEKFKKASLSYLLLLTPSQRNEPNDLSWLPFNVFRGLKKNFTHEKSQKTKICTQDKKNSIRVKLETFPSHLHHRTWMR